METRGESADGVGGTDEGRVWVGTGGGMPFALGWISPLAVASLFVKEEMAQPDHEVSFWGVPMRGTAPLVVVALGGGRMVSGNVVPYLRMRLR